MSIRNKSRFVNAIVATVLTVTLLCSSVIPVFAASVGGSFTPGGGAAADGDYAYNGAKGVIKICASYISDDSNVAQMADVNNRYGSLGNYPLLMQSGKWYYNGSKVASHSTSWKNDIAYVKEKANEEYNKWLTIRNRPTASGRTDNRANWQREFRNSGGEVGVTTYKAESDTVYLEDCITKVMNMSSSSLSNNDKIAFWYFYTRMAMGVNSDISMWTDDTYNNKSTLGSTLNSAITDGVGSSGTKAELFKRGYTVALACTYGFNSIPVKSLLGKTFSTSSSTSWSSSYKSLYVERLEAIPLTYYKSNGDTDRAEVLLSVRDYLELVNAKCSTITNTAMEGRYYNQISWHSTKCPCSLEEVFESMKDMIYPVRTNGSNIKDGGSIAFGGWGYYVFDEPKNPPVKDLLIDPKNIKQIATEVTYNAYLTLSKDSDITKESSAFGDNGHVMTDTVFLSGIDSDFLKSTIADSKYYLPTTVDKSISLTTPIANTKYNLARLQYQIATANGSNGSDGYNLLGDNVCTTYNSNSSAVTSDTPKVRIKGSDINKAMENSNSKFLYRVKKSLGGTSVEDGLNADGTDAFPLYKYNGKGYVTITTNDCKYGVSTKKVFENSGATTVGTYSSGDTDKHSTNFFYIKNNNKYYPVYFSYGTWYYCPVVSYQNLLVQIRADYVASYDSGSITNTSGSKIELFKNADFEDYLLAKNDSSESFRNMDLYTMIDNYATDVWGTLTNRQYVSTTTAGSITKLNSGTKYNYNRASLMAADGYFYDAGNKKNGAYADIIWSGGKNTIRRSTATLTGGNNRKIEYVTNIVKSAPTILSNTASNTFTSSNLSVNVWQFNDSGVKSKNSSVNKYGIWYTKPFEHKSSKTSVTDIKENASKSSPAYLDNTKDYLEAEGYVHSDSENIVKGVSIPDILYVDNGGKVTTGYTECYFTKLLTAYNAYIYTKRAEKSINSTPVAANWISGNVANASDFGISGSNVGKAITAESKNLGFLRFGSTDNSNNDGIAFLGRQNNMGKDASILQVGTDTNIDDKIISSKAYQGSGYKFVAPFTQSSIDVPMTYNFKTVTPNDITPTAPSTSYSTSGSTLTESAYIGTNLNVYPEVTMWAENDKSNSPSSDTTYTPIVTVGQKQRNIPIVAYNTLKLTTPDHNPTITGTAIAFDTRAKRLAERLGASKAPVFYSGSGINVAIDNTTVGTVSTYYLDIGNSTLKTAWGNSSIASKSIVSDFANRLSATVATKVDVKNGDTIVKTLDFGGEGGKKDCSIKVDDPVSTEETIELTVKGGILTKVKYLENGLHANYTVINAVSDDVSLAFDSTASNTVSANSSTELDLRAKVLSILKGTKVVGKNNMLVQSLQNGGGTEVNSSLKNWLHKINDGRFTTANGWYMEDTSVLVIKGYETNLKVTGVTYTDQIPLNLGPATPADKNNYFSNGYKGIINSTYAFRYKRADGTVVPYVFQTSTFNNKTDFIVADVTINDATTY